MILPDLVGETVVSASEQVAASEPPASAPAPNQTIISTPTSNLPENQHSPQKAIPEPVVETVVSESVSVTESD